MVFLYSVRNAYATTTFNVNLGNADPSAVFAGSMVTNTGPTTISEDLGVRPGTAITGFPPGVIDAQDDPNEVLLFQIGSTLTTASRSPQENNLALSGITPISDTNNGCGSALPSNGAATMDITMNTNILGAAGCETTTDPPELSTASLLLLICTPGLMMVAWLLRKRQMRHIGIVDGQYAHDPSQE